MMKWIRTRRLSIKNSLSVRAGRASDARPWVEVLREGASVPPNVRDCHFRLKPRAQCAPVLLFFFITLEPGVE
jgi:hypothetical protein